MPTFAIPPAQSDPQGFLQALFRTAVARAQPLSGMAQHLPAVPRGRTLVLGAGKAGGAMAQALEQLWPQGAPLSGLVVTRYGHVPPRPAGLAQRIEVVEAAHPVPDAAGLQAAERMLALAQGLSADIVGVIAQMSIGEVSDPVALPDGGAAIFELQDRQGQPFDAVADQLRASLSGDAALGRLVQQHLADADVHIDPRFGSWDPATGAVRPPDGSSVPQSLLVDDPLAAPGSAPAGG